MPAQQKGFSIVEILIVLAIISILAVALMPAYKTYQLKSNRSDAIRSILAIQIAEEKYRIANTSYGNLAAVWSGTNSYDGYYQMSVTNNTASSYTITASALSTQSADTNCATMTLTYANGTATQSPSSCWQ